MPTLKRAKSARRNASVTNAPARGKKDKEEAGDHSPASARSWLDSLAALPVLLLLAISCGMRPPEIREADVFWHLATGRWMLEQGQIAFSDPFSHTAAAIPWANHEWLFQVLLRLVQQGGGVLGLYAVKVLLYTAAIALPAWFSRCRGVGVTPLVGAAALALFAGIPFSEYRPLMISVVLLALAAEGARRASAGQRPPLFWLPAMFCLWANLHATFPLGLLAVGCFVLLPEPGQDPWRARRRMVLLLAACAAATLLNPYFAGVWTVPAKVGGSELFMSSNEEWRPPDLSSEYWPFYATLPVLAGAALLRGRRAFSGEWLLAFVLAAASFKSRRIIPLYAIAAIVPLAFGLAAAGRHLARSSPLPRAAAPLALLALILAGAGWATRITSPQSAIVATADRLTFPNGAFPASCAQTLSEAAPGGRLFNDYNHGGFLHYSVGPEWKVFIDGRNDLYGEELTLLYNSVALAQGDWRRELDSRDVDAALVSYAICMHRPNLALALEQDPRWALVDFDDAGLLFLRRDHHPSEWIAAREYRTVKPMLLYEEQAAGHQQRGAFGAFISELRRRAASGRSRVAEQMLARALLDSNQTNEALQVLDRADAFFGPDDLSQEIRTAALKN